MNRVVLLSLVGFIGGSIVGFAWSKATKSRLKENIQADFKDGVIDISVDVGQSAKQGLLDFLKG